MTLKNCSKIIITVPSTNYESDISFVEFSARVNEVEKYLINEFGGVTSIEHGQGKWLDADGNLIPENIALASIKLDGLLEDSIALETKVLEWKRAWNQYCILLEVSDTTAVLVGV